MEYVTIIKKLSNNLITTYNNSIKKHPGSIGNKREKALIDYLSKVMPYKYGFKAGEVFDSEGGISGQVDIIMYDSLFSTIFTDDTDDIVAPVESTYGIISVKSKMGIKELNQAIDGVKKYDMLKRPEPKPNTVYPMPDCPIEGVGVIKVQGQALQNINCIFAYDTIVAPKTMIGKIKKAGCIDLLVVPEKYCIIGRWRSIYGLSKAGQPLSNYIFKSENSIAIFILFLQTYLSGSRLMSSGVQNYITWLIKQSELII